MSRILFVTGTDTGVGKTLLTVSLLQYLRERGFEARAMKPFCSGGIEDVEQIEAVQGKPPSRRDVNPFFFRAALAPGVAAMREGRRIPLRRALGAIRRIAQRCECLIVEGAGGLLSPLGRRYSSVDLISALKCGVVVVGRNRLGVLNHVLLTVEALKARRVKTIQVVLMDERAPDASARSNPDVLATSLAPIEVLTIPYLGREASTSRSVKRNAKKTKKTLARLATFATFLPRSLERRRLGGPKPKRLRQKAC